MEQENRELEEITIKDIARMCGVGVSTVSRAINNHPDINPETKQKVMDIIQKYGYIPNNSARYLKRMDGKCIAVLVKGLTNPFFAGAIKVMEDEIKKKKYSMVIRHVESDEDEVDVALELVKEKRLAGLIFLGGHFVHSEEKLSKLRIPFILSTVGEGPDGLPDPTGTPQNRGARCGKRRCQHRSDASDGIFAGTSGTGNRAG